MKSLGDRWERLAGAGLVGVGAVALLLGYLGASSTPYVADQIPYVISGGLSGIFCLGLAATFYISGDMRREWQKMDRLEAHLQALSGEPPEQPQSERRAREPAPESVTEPVPVVARTRKAATAKRKPQLT